MHGLCFLSRCGVRDVRVTHQVSQGIRYYSPPTGGTTEGKLRSTSAHCANCATTRKTAHEVRWSRVTNKTLHSAWFTKHTTRLRIHPCACLKHSNFLNTDRMRKSGLSNGCSRETLLLFSLQQFSPKTCQAASEQLKSYEQGSVHSSLVEHLCLFRIA